jgi:hypothetical protein
MLMEIREKNEMEKGELLPHSYRGPDAKELTRETKFGR